MADNNTPVSDSKKPATTTKETVKTEIKKTETVKPAVKKTETKMPEVKKTEVKKTEVKKTETRKAASQKPMTVPLGTIDDGKSSKGTVIIIIAAVILAIACIILGIAFLKNTGKIADKEEEVTEETTETTDNDYSEEPVQEPKNYPPADEYTISYDEAVSLYNVPEISQNVTDLASNTNPEVYAVVSLPGCNIEEPVLQSASDELYYSSHSVSGGVAEDGCVYSQIFNNKDFNDNLTAIYGRNTDDGRLFSNLHYYEDPNFLNENPYIYVYTDSQVLVYKIYGAFTYPALHLLVVFDTNTDEGYARFIDEMCNLRLELNDNIVSDFKPAATDKMLVLSTGVSGDMDIRYLVESVLVAKANIP